MKPVPSTTPNARGLLRTPTVVRRRGRTALAAFVVAMVIGILGMHALSTHGTPPAPTVDSTSSTAVTGGTSAHDTAAHLGAERNSGDSSGSGHDPGAMVMWCVVMLATAALSLFVLLAVRVIRSWLPAAFHPAAARARALPRIRGTGPPHEWQFSVIRC